MNSKLIYLAILNIGILMLACSPKLDQGLTQATVSVQNNHVSEQLDNIAQNVFQKEKFPGMAIMVWKDGDYVFEEGYGFINIEDQIPVDPRSSLFRIGSVSKPVTAALMAKLIEEDKLNLDADIRRYVPYFPEKEYTISTRQLAGHLGGIRHYRGMENFNKTFYPTVKEGLDIFIQDSLIHKPGSKFSYSSYGWNLLSAVLEGAGENDFLTMMNDYVFDPLQLESMQAEMMSKPIENKVAYYQKNLAGENILAPEVDNSYKWAGGGFISSAEDVVKFAIAHIKSGYLESGTLQELFKTQYTTDGKATNYGLGWRSGEDKKGRKWIGHSGGSVGGTTMMLIYPDENIIVVTLVNLSRAKTGDLAFRLANQLFPISQN